MRMRKTPWRETGAPKVRGRIIVWILALMILTGMNMIARPALAETRASGFAFPTVNPDHRHAQALLENSTQYLAPENKIKDPSSGYPVEGWNNEPDKGLALRTFTQLTAIGEWTELLANVVAGNADTPYLSREQALKDLQQIVHNLLQDQKNPEAGSKGLLSNFLDLAPGRRMGPLSWVAERKQFLNKFGEARGAEIWQALCSKGWLSPQGNSQEAAILRNADYGSEFFNGPLAPYSDETTKTEIMQLLDQRNVILVYGDNVNLSMSVGSAIGTLMAPTIRDNPEIERIRKDMDQFLDGQKDGYSFLYDGDTGLFFFGWDATRNRFLGWQDANGKMRPGHMDYMINEFRGPTAFVVMRFGLPTSAFANLGFTMKPYRLDNGREAHVLAPWEGSAFQALGLSLSAADGGYRSWQVLMKNIVEVEIDYSRRRNLPGFLSESYVAEGARYTGDVGIPEIAVNSAKRITSVASLYTLGVAYAAAPSEVEKFLADNWPMISSILTDHGPWEGYDMDKKGAVRVQTTAHTLSLILGFLGTSPANMMRYLDSRGLHPRLREIYPVGKEADLLSGANNFAWGDAGSSVQVSRRPAGFTANGSDVKKLGWAFVSPDAEGMNLSNGVLTLRYRNSKPFAQAKIRLKPVKETLLPIELTVNLDQTNGEEKEMQVTLPAAAGLTKIKEAVLECSPTGPVDFTISTFNFTPYS